MRFLVLGLSITSSWGNGHASTYRSLLRALSARGHDVLFLEREFSVFADNRDLPNPDFCHVEFYHSCDDLQRRFTATVRSADVVVVGSHLPQGDVIGEWVIDTTEGLTAFYDLDTPHTVTTVAAGTCGYVTKQLVPRYQLYLSTSGGPVLEHIERTFGSPAARALYCSFDPALCCDVAHVAEPWDLGYMGVYSADRQPLLVRLLLDSARRWAGGRFIVVGPHYPASIMWPPNVARTNYLSPVQHRTFYGSQRFTLNITRSALAAAGFSPGIRLFEAAACGTPIITDQWEGLDTFFTPEREILVARTWRDVLPCLIDMPEAQRRTIAGRARERVLREHSAVQRARQLEAYVRSAQRAENRGQTERATAAVDPASSATLTVGKKTA